MSYAEDEIIHRVRNEGTEKDLPEGKFCDRTPLLANEHGSVVNQDVTCLKCLAVLIDLKIVRITEKEKVDEPIVIMCQHVKGSDQCYSQLIIGSENDIVSGLPLPSVWIVLGDSIWYLGKKNTLKLRDYCNAVLGDIMLRIEPAFDGNAVNPK